MHLPDYRHRSSFSRSQCWPRSHAGLQCVSADSRTLYNGNHRQIQTPISHVAIAGEGEVQGTEREGLSERRGGGGGGGAVGLLTEFSVFRFLGQPDRRISASQKLECI